MKKIIRQQDYYYVKAKIIFTAEYALRNISSPIGVSEYKLLEDIPEYLQAQLPKAEEIELHIKDIEKIEKQQDNEEQKVLNFLDTIM